jgi:hypothetical protein
MMELAQVPNGTPYRYSDKSLQIIWQTSVPKTDDEALEYFYTICTFNPKEFHPVYVERYDHNFGWIMLPYRAITDELFFEVVGI